MEEVVEKAEEEEAPERSCSRSETKEKSGGVSIRSDDATILSTGQGEQLKYEVQQLRAEKEALQRAARRREDDHAKELAEVAELVKSLSSELNNAAANAELLHARKEVLDLVTRCSPLPVCPRRVARSFLPFGVCHC
eukprot:751738-Hanusia_phi.AAC.2